MITVGTESGPGHLETVVEIEIELMKIIKDFDRALNVNFEDLHLAKKSGKHSSSRSGNHLF